MAHQKSLARNIAAAFLAGPLDLKGMVDRGVLACGGGRRWLRYLARLVLSAHQTRTLPQDSNALADWLAKDVRFDRGLRSHGQALGLRQIFWISPEMTPFPGAPASWSIPSLATSAALSEWLGLDLPHLDWFADCRGREAAVPAGPLRHYTYRWLEKTSGKGRLLEMPKRRLKAIQRRLLHEILDQIPPHEAAHGYRRNRSIVTFAQPHVRKAMVLRFDLQEFFPSIQPSRVHALFRAAGYPAAVARLLTGLCTNTAPPEVLAAVPQRKTLRQDDDSGPLYRWPHLPQGAPTSPALANLCAYRLDCRLNGLARALGGTYTRYADDLAFSGGENLERCVRRLQVQVCRIALEEGFSVQIRKTRFMRRGVRQQIVGVVVNERLNVRRKDYDSLKAILHNCSRFGPSSQNREDRPDFRAYLLGRIGHVAALHPTRGQRLKVLFDQVDWDESVKSGE